jgi:small ligand-binding sensory domain FIST
MAHYAAALSQHPVPVEAVGECAGQLLDALAGTRPDLVVVFASAPHSGAFGDIAGALRSLLDPAVLIGTTAVAVAGGALEVEDDPALSVWAGAWDCDTADTDTPHVRGVRLEAHPDGDGGASIVGWPDDLPPIGTLVLLADPFTFPVADVLDVVNRGVPGLTIVGGLASAARGPGGNRLVLDGDVVTSGAVGVLLDADVPVWTAVSQGCRPIGQPFTVTAAERNLVGELAGQPALSRLQQLAASVADDDRELMRLGLHVGIVVDEHKAEFGRGDFLVRNVLGADPARGALAVGDVVEVGQTVQFHVRDAASADSDLRIVASRAFKERQPRGALLFTCNGRGVHLFGTPHHDAALLQELAGDGLALGGMFCAGEIGPVGGRAHLHGFTASVAVFGDD